MTSLWLDLRYALRTMAKAPALTAVLLITLALGIGATTTIFSVVHSVILRPLPYPQPDQLARLYTEIAGKVGLPRVGLATVEVRDLRRDCRTCAAIAAWREASASLAGGDRPVRVHGIYATHELLPLLGVRPELGRWFDASETHPGDPTVVVLGHDVWQRVFNGDPGVIGKQVQLDAVTVTVIGVMPAGFRFPERAEIWVPSRVDFSQDDGASFNEDAIVRLAPGASPAALEEELGVLSRRWTDWLNVLAAQVGYPTVTLRAHAVAFHADLVGSVSTALWLLQAAVLFVLLIAIVNVANLLLARSETRTREVAVRHALGASRRRLVRQFVTESLLLGLCGGGLGILVAMWAIDGVAALIPRAAPRATEVALDGPAVAFAVACSIAAALVFGLAPILHARRTDLHGALKDGSPRTTGSRARLRVRRALVISEIALAVVLVVGCTAIVRSFLRLQRVDLGFAPDHLLTFGVELPDKTYHGAAGIAFWRRLEDRLRALPGVRGAALVEQLPPTHSKNFEGVSFPGRSASDANEPDWIIDFIQTADEAALDTLGARVVHGRAFAASDALEAPSVALVNESFVAKYFRGREPIGQRVTLLFGYQREVTVVGVFADVKREAVDKPAGTELMMPLQQYPQRFKTPTTLDQMFAVLRTTDDPAALIPAVQRAVAELDPTLPLFDVHTMDDVLWEAVARPRFLMFLLSSFAGIALLLAAVGIYGVMAHTVAQRTHEIGLRVALGARPGQVRAMVLRQAATLVIAGVLVGLAVAVALSVALGSSLSGMFYGEPLAAPGLLAAVALAVIATALLATWIPVRRATEIQPTVALRTE
ncbi:MAG TPA: ABC transporter permease [Kofleriaceae bacterium]|nr:ABC transporter permease [Kofleriaceae bacterium]